MNPPSLSPSARSSAGFTLLELLVVIGMIGILIAIAAPNLRAPSSRLAANSLQATVQQARFEAIKRNRPVVVELLDGNQGIRLSSTVNAGSISCAGLSPIRTVEVSELGQVALVPQNLPFVWLPNGNPRACGGGALAGEPSITVSDQSATFTVAVSLGGEVHIR